MSVEKVIMFEVRCDVCDRFLDDGEDGAALLWRDRDEAVHFLKRSTDYRPDMDWIALSDGRAFCPTHGAAAPFEQTGPDLFAAAADVSIGGRS